MRIDASSLTFTRDTLCRNHLYRTAAVTLLLLALTLASHTCARAQASDKIVLTNGTQLTGQVASIGCFREKPLNLTMRIEKVQADGAKINVGDIETLVLSQSGTPVVLSRTGAFSNVPTGVADAFLNYIRASGDRTLALPAGVSAASLTSLNALLVDVCTSRQNKSVWRGSMNVNTAAVVGTNIQKTLGGTLFLSYERNPARDDLSHTFTKLDLESSYGSSRKRGQPATVSTQWSYGKLEQDFSLGKKTFLSAFASLYHNFSTGMRLQQAAGVGLQYSVTDDFSVGADIRGLRQKLYAPSDRFSSLAAGLSESYTTLIPNTPVVFTERLEVALPFKTMNAMQLRWVSFLMMPVTKRVNFTVEYDDDYLRNAPVGYRQNFSKVSLGVGLDFNSRK
jgi:hypothetical protein